MGSSQTTGVDVSLDLTDTSPSSYTQRVSTATDQLIGHLVDQRYLVQSVLASGGMATVYLANDRRLERDLALKVMHPQLAANPEFVARFTQEARTAARLSHPNIVQVFDQGADGQWLYLAMELLSGRTLRDVLHERSRLQPDEALAVLEPIVDALRAAHDLGIIHRDIKPENIILTDEGRVKVADFGLARVLAGPQAFEDHALIGTAAYMAPEVVQRQGVDARSDVYSAGILLFEMLTGRQPFTGSDPVQVAQSHVTQQVPAPSKLAADVPTELDNLVLTATAREITDRPQDAGEWLQAISRVHTGLQRPPAQQPAVTATAIIPLVTSTASTEQYATPPPELAELQSLRERTTREAHEDRVWHTDPGLEHYTHTRRRRGAIALAVIGAILVLLIAGALWWSTKVTAVIPTLANLNQKEAQTALQQRGLTGVEAGSEYSNTIAAGRIVRSEPETGSHAPENGQVRFWISKGPDAISIPNVRGKDPGEAADILREKGFEVSDTPQQAESSDVEYGKVVETQPKGKAKRGETLTLVVSNGGGFLDIPNVTGWNLEDARKKLEELGLGVDVQYEGNDMQQGTVIRQDVTGGGQRRSGDRVTLVVSSGQGGGDQPGFNPNGDNDNGGDQPMDGNPFGF